MVDNIHIQSVLAVIYISWNAIFSGFRPRGFEGVIH